MHTDIEAPKEGVPASTARNLAERRRWVVRAKIPCAISAFLALGIVGLIGRPVLDLALDGALMVHSPAGARAVCFLGANPNDLDNGRTRLEYAVEAVDAQNVAILLDVGADPNVRSHLAHFFSAAPPGDKGDAVLNVAVYLHEEAIIRLLLEHGADPNAVDEDGTTPLRTAREKHFADTIALLKQFGAR